MFTFYYDYCIKFCSIIYFLCKQNDIKGDSIIFIDLYNFFSYRKLLL